ncbi:unnamed protein product [Orchesella dallaii]|uniref:Uncharacterized protein n=1 Tax=Orchesella dallaii TaxID=48710 RepID=A0ABP1QHC7_9HEXA
MRSSELSLTNNFSRTIFPQQEIIVCSAYTNTLPFAKEESHTKRRAKEFIQKNLCHFLLHTLVLSSLDLTFQKMKEFPFSKAGVVNTAGLLGAKLQLRMLQSPVFLLLFLGF